MSEQSPDASTEIPPASGWRAFFPPAQWLRSYRIPWLRYDVVAGVTLAAYAIPVSLAYATLAGLPPQYGIYCYLVAGPAYALFGSSRQLAIGPTSAISLLVGTTLVGMAQGDPQRWAEIAALTALIFAGMSVLAWLLRLSSLVSFISETILLGFKAGAALTIALTQLPKLFGVPGGGENFFERLWILGTQLGSTNFAVLGFGLAAIGLLVAGEKFFPGRPIALFVVAASIVTLSLTPLAQLGFKTVGALPVGLPDFAFPSLRPRDVDGVIPLALACFLLAYIEGVSAARTLSERHGDAVDARQELLALGAANVAAGLWQGYPVAGGLSQSTVNDKAGAKTPLALVIASIAIALCLVFLTGLIANLPNVVLAALVSMLLLIHRVARPHVAKLGRVPGTQRYSDLERNPDNEPVPGALILRVESSILYFNIDHVRECVNRHIAEAGKGLRLVVWDLSSSPYVDIAGGRLLGEVQRELAARSVKLRLVDARATVRDLLREEIGVSLGEVTRRMSVDDVIRSEGPAVASPASGSAQ